jgi:putative membrane protein
MNASSRSARMTRIAVSPGIMALFWASAMPAGAHTADGSVPATAWSGWTFDPLVLTSLIAIAVLYTRGLRRLWRRGGSKSAIPSTRVLALAFAIFAIAAALVSPIERWSGALFSVHMVQHLLLVVVAAPLLAISRAWTVLLWALPDGWRRSMIGTVRSQRSLVLGWRYLSLPVAAWTAHGVIIWLWHVPPLYDAALAYWLLHHLEHLTMFLSAGLAWWSILRPGVARQFAVAVLCLFATVLHTGLLSALMTFSAQPWYASHLATAMQVGITPLEDQQIAGMIMWVPMSVVYVVAAAVLLGQGLQRMAARSGNSLALGGQAFPDSGERAP